MLNQSNRILICTSTLYPRLSNVVFMQHGDPTIHHGHPTLFSRDFHVPNLSCPREERASFNEARGTQFS